MTVERRTDPAVMWHDVECGAYAADLPFWHELAAAAAGPVLEISTAPGRVSLSLAAAGHEVVALDRDAALLAALADRGGDLPVTIAQADARDFELGRTFALCLIPMQTIQLVPDAAERARVLACARRHMVSGGKVAIAVTADLEPFEAGSSPRSPTCARRTGSSTPAARWRCARWTARSSSSASGRR